MSKPDDSSWEKAERLFAVYVAAREEGETPDFDALKAEHPECAEHLERLRRESDAFDAVTPPRPGPAERSEPGSLASDTLVQNLPDEDGGKRLGPCILRQILGHGGFGRVYRARHTGFDVDVAVKCLNRDVAERGRSVLERFRREARLTLDLHSENIVRVLHVGEERGIHYLVMEFVDGETARGRVTRKGPLAPAEAVTIARAAARGLAALHESGVVHRDVKHDNLLISADGEVKLADLGLAKADLDQTGVTETGEGLGTPYFMAPEQFRGAKTVGPPSDVYALGATLYYLLVGRPGLADSGSTPYEVAHAALEHGHPELRDARPDLDPRLAAVVSRATERRAEDRYEDGAALLAALDALPLASVDLAEPVDAAIGGAPPLRVSPPPARPVGVRLRTRHGDTTEAPPRRSKRVSLAWVGVAVLSLTGVVAVTTRDPEPEPPKKATSPDAAPADATLALVDEAERLEQHAEAILLLEELVSATADSEARRRLGVAWVRYALAAKQLADSETAAERFLRASELGVESALAQAADAEERAARERSKDGRLHEARTLAARALEHGPSERRRAFVADLDTSISERLFDGLEVSPPSGETLGTASFDVVIDPHDAAVETLEIDGVPMNRDGDGQFRTTLELAADGLRALPLTFLLEGDVRVESTVTWTIDTRPPLLRWTPPATKRLDAIRAIGEDGLLLYCITPVGNLPSDRAAPLPDDLWQSELVIEGVVDEPAGIRFGGRRIETDPDGRFSVSIADPRAAASTIEATDRAGHVTTVDVPLPEIRVLEAVRLRRDEEGVAYVCASPTTLELVFVPASDAGPAFFLGRYEVTNLQYQELAGELPTQRDTGFTVWQEWRELEPNLGITGIEPFLSACADHPVVDMTYDEAVDWCARAGGRLPSSREWTWAASGPERWLFPFSRLDPGSQHRDANWSGYSRGPAERTPAGEEPEPDAWVHWTRGGRGRWAADGYVLTAPAEPFGRAGPFGTYHQGGNVEEWVAREAGTSPRAAGGSYASLKNDLRVGATRPHAASARRPTLGFRLAVPIRFEK